MIVFNYLFLITFYISCLDPYSVIADDGSLDALASLNDIPAIRPRIVNGFKSNPLTRRFFAKSGTCFKNLETMFVRILTRRLKLYN